jgi:hypothetical protein
MKSLIMAMLCPMVLRNLKEGQGKVKEASDHCPDQQCACARRHAGASWVWVMASLVFGIYAAGAVL